MTSAAYYRILALDCLELAQGTANPETRNTFIRLAELWARLAGRIEADRQSRADAAGDEAA